MPSLKDTRSQKHTFLLSSEQDQFPPDLPLCLLSNPQYCQRGQGRTNCDAFRA